MMSVGRKSREHSVFDFETCVGYGQWYRTHSTSVLGLVISMSTMPSNSDDSGFRVLISSFDFILLFFIIW